MTAQQLREERMSQGIPARLVAPRARVSSKRLSDIEPGYVEAITRIAHALKELIAARREVRVVAERVGWPAESV